MRMIVLRPLLLKLLLTAESSLTAYTMLLGAARQDCSRSGHHVDCSDSLLKTGLKQCFYFYFSWFTNLFLVIRSKYFVSYFTGFDSSLSCSHIPAYTGAHSVISWWPTTMLKLHCMREQWQWDISWHSPSFMIINLRKWEIVQREMIEVELLCKMSWSTRDAELMTWSEEFAEFYLERSIYKSNDNSTKIFTLSFIQFENPLQLSYVKNFRVPMINKLSLVLVLKNGLS